MICIFVSASEAATDYENRLKKHFQNSSMVEISGKI